MDESQIFVRALKVAKAAERAAYLDVACQGRPKLREDVEALLRAHLSDPEFLEKPVDGVDVTINSDRDCDEPVIDKEDLSFLAPSTQKDSLGRLGHYEILEVIGQGGMGTVLRAFDAKLQRVVAIKAMAAPLAANATARRRFIREAQAAAAVSHDHIVTIHAVEDSVNRPYLVMYYVSGQSLQQRLDRTGPLQLHEILRIGMQTASGLAAAHAQGIVHRDVKPANILLENGVERVKITDFGLARAVSDASLTQQGVVAGTPSYMAPEQARGETLDQRADLFSLGSVLYAMCTGRAPFRGRDTIAVLKRVCDETPPPIREANSSIPEELVAVIEKLHAKNPADRYQTAAEVAQILGQQLAHTQHPSVAKLPASPMAGKQQYDSAPVPAKHRNPARSTGRRRWAVAAVVLALLLAGLSLGEATGVTTLRAIITRIVTPDGTLVVETDDPNVNLTVEGDGGLAIAGAGIDEVRLHPGSYKVHAAKDGKPVAVDRELVTISSGRKQVVRVRVEGASSSPAATPPTTERGAFVLLGGEGVAGREFDTLAAAVIGASDGDTIEIRGNGPFLCNSVAIHSRALAIRAGEGYRPVLELSREAAESQDHFITTDARLVLEGLEFTACAPSRLPPGWNRPLVQSRGAPLYVANCRFLAPNQDCIRAWNSPSLSVRNSELLSLPGTGIFGIHASRGQMFVDNCVQVGGIGVCLVGYLDLAPSDAVIRLVRNSMSSGNAVWFNVSPDLDFTGEAQSVKPVHIDASDNVFHTRSVILNFEQGRKLAGPEAEAVAHRLLDWREQRNVCMPGKYSVQWSVNAEVQPTHGPKSLAEWRQFWKTEGKDLLEGQVRYQGGDLSAKLEATPEKLTPADFRLRLNSAGYRAGPNGKDLGADVDLVGPGEAYERWKKTPEYQDWKKETGQLRTAAPRPKPGAFVVVGGKGVAEQKFDTLAAAVTDAADGSTIEIRGNGPFVSDGVSVTRPLVIRAGAGFTPSITLSAASAETNIPLFTAHDRLVLEGLELKRRGGAAVFVEERAPVLLLAWEGGSLQIANCRLIYQGDSPDWVHGSLVSSLGKKSLIVRNCAAYGNLSTESGGGFCESDCQYRVENCIWTMGGIGFGLVKPVQNVDIRIRGNTFVGNCLNLTLFNKPEIMEKAEPGTSIRLELSENVGMWDQTTRNYAFLYFHQAHGQAVLPAPEAESMLRHLVQLDEKQNVYQLGAPMLRVATNWLTQENATRGQDLSDWNEFWGQQRTGSVAGKVRFQGGDLIDRARLAPGQLSVEDFRLRPDSAGYRAGPNGKDLGADVELVGPGEAYERWKKTPEYQEWLADSGQRK